MKETRVKHCSDLNNLHFIHANKAKMYNVLYVACLIVLNTHRVYIYYIHALVTPSKSY